MMTGAVTAEDHACFFPGGRRGRYRCPTGIPAGEVTFPAGEVTFVPRLSDLQGCFGFLLSFQTDVGGWELDIPGSEDSVLMLYALNTDLRDPADSAAAMRWATGYIERADAHEAQRVAELRDGPAVPAPRVTQWCAVEVYAQVCYVPLFTDTAVCLTPFTGLEVATGSACPCVTHRGDDR